MGKSHEIILFATVSYGCKGENILCNHESWLQRIFFPSQPCLTVAKRLISWDFPMKIYICRILLNMVGSSQLHFIGQQMWSKTNIMVFCHGPWLTGSTLDISLIIEQSSQVGDGRHPVGCSPGSWLLVSERPLAWPWMVYLCHLEDVLVAGLVSRGHREPGAEPLPPGGEPLEPELGQLVGQGRRPVTHDGRHGHPLAPLQGLPLCQENGILDTIFGKVSPKM